MSSFGGFGVPGHGALVETSEREILWGGDDAKGRCLFESAVIDGTARDAGNTPTTVLRPGLLLGTITATGQRKEWNPDGTDGSEYITGVLWKELRAQDFDANNVDRAFTILVGGPVRAGQLLVEGTALTSSTDEPLARRAMVSSGRFVFDDDPLGYLAGMGGRFETVTATSDTLLKSDNGKTILYSNAASVTVTLPAIKPGLEFDLIRTGDEEFIVNSAEGDNMIVGNDLSADGITHTTAGQHIAARIRIKSVYVATTLKWLVELPVYPFGTGLTGGFAYSIAT